MQKYVGAKAGQWRGHRDLYEGNNELYIDILSQPDNGEIKGTGNDSYYGNFVFRGFCAGNNTVALQANSFTKNQTISILYNGQRTNDEFIKGKYEISSNNKHLPLLHVGEFTLRWISDSHLFEQAH